MLFLLLMFIIHNEFPKRHFRHFFFVFWFLCLCHIFIYIYILIFTVDVIYKF